jgi:hypothetical protein
MFRFHTACLCLLACMSAIFLSACSEPNTSVPASSSGFGSPDLRRWKGAEDPGLGIRGTARVLSVDRPTGSAVLNYNGQRVQVYWQTETVYAPVLTGTPLNSTTAPSGKYLEPQVVDHNFPAKPGDTIAFLGIQTGDAIFLQGVAVIAP